jgi:AmmeMemoRadiSam system protein B
MNDTLPVVRRDLEFFPLQHGGQQLFLIRDHLGLVQEGKIVAPHLYRIMTLLDGNKTLRDLQMEMMRLKGGVLVGADEVKKVLAKLDDSFLLDSDRFKREKQQIVSEFTAKKTRPCSHCGRSYPQDPIALKKMLDEILGSLPPSSKPQGKIKALVCPHIDPSAGSKVYASAYQMLTCASLQRVVVLGTGHQLAEGLFSLTEKDFLTPLGIVKNESALTQELRDVAAEILAADDFAHRSEHSIEFQIIFLQHLFSEATFKIIPILCGSLQTNLSAYTRSAYLEKAGPFLEKLKQIILDEEKDTMVVAGVDFSHIGLKFGHDRPAEYLERQTEIHDKNLIQYLCRFETDNFWEEFIAVEDRFNVCGFPAMACLLEILPKCQGEILGYRLRHEAATQSAVSFAAVVFS